MASRLAARFAFVVVALGALAASTSGKSWGPRKDRGLAVVDRRTGETLWEAWRLEDIPADTPKDVRAAAERMLKLAAEEWPGRAPGNTTRLGEDLHVDVEREALTLSRGTPDRKEVVARYSLAGVRHYGYAIANQTLYLMHNGRVVGFSGRKLDIGANQEWRPVWTFDVFGDWPPDPVLKPVHASLSLTPDGEGVWVLNGPHVWRLTADGKKQYRFTVNDPWTDFDAIEPPYLTVTDRRLYCHRPDGVVAIERQTKQEVWRLPTTLFPFTSRLQETGSVVVIEIGSDLPTTIREAVVLRNEFILKRLGPNGPAFQAAAATLLRWHGDGYHRRKYEALSRQYSGQADAESQAAAKVIDAALVDWPRKRDRRRLWDRAVAEVIAKPDPAEPPAFTAARRRLTWSVLQEFVYGRTCDAYDGDGTLCMNAGWDEFRWPLPDDVGAKLIAECRRVLADGPAVERPFAGSLLVASSVAWEGLPTAERKALFLSADPAVWRWTTMALAKNGQREQLIEWFALRPAAERIDVLWVLEHDRPKAPGAAEHGFWLACLRDYPDYAARVLNGRDDPIPVEFRAPIREYLEREIANPSATDAPFAAVQVLHKWNDPKDNALLLKYLTHPARDRSSRTNGEVRDEYRLRQYVRSWLEKRGVPIPAGVVYEEVVRPKK